LVTFDSIGYLGLALQFVAVTLTLSFAPVFFNFQLCLECSDSICSVFCAGFCVCLHHDFSCVMEERIDSDALLFAGWNGV